MSGLNDESLLLEFVAESREHLSSIEPDLLTLEKDGEQAGSEIINRVFRAIHSIKGASGFFGLEALKSLSHSMENVLMLMRDGQLGPTPQVMDPLLIGVDCLRLMLDDISASEEVPYQHIVTQLEALINGEQSSAVVPEAEPTASATVTAEPAKATPVDKASTAVSDQKSSFTIDQATLEKAVKSGQKLYAIDLCADTDLARQNWNVTQFYELMLGTGTVLDVSHDLASITNLETALDAPLNIKFLYGSVLESDLLSIAFGIPESEIKLVTPDEVLGNAKPATLTVQPAPIAEAPKEPAAKSATTAPGAPVDAAPKAVKAPAPAAPAPAEKSAKAPSKPSNNSNDTSNESIRVKVDLLNRLMDLAGELVLARNQLTRAFENQKETENTGLAGIIQNVDLITSDLQEHIMHTRMQPISSVFGKFPRVIRDLSKHLGKEIELQMTGEEVELDKSILESLSDPLTHLIRNCCDHGMETPDVREQAGKPRLGTVLLKAYQESGHINIAVIDDGAGIDHERIASKAIEKGLITEATLRQMTVQEQVNLIFAPGFSTAEQITDVSGRGVGMDVVRTNIEQIGGSIAIETEKGQGTTILLRLPLTLAIVPSLVVEAAQQIFAVPQINLVELVCVQAAQIATRIEKVGSAPVLRLRGKLLPLVKLSAVLGLAEPLEGYTQSDLGNPSSKDGKPSLNRRENIHDERLLEEHPNLVQERRQVASDYNILVLKSVNREYGLIVDEIKDIEEIVVKPMSQYIKNCKCFSGATIMGDGHVAMILDVGGIMSTSGLSFQEISAEEDRRNQEAAVLSSKRNGGEKQSILLFNSSPTEVFAVPLSDILRLEKFEMDDVERIGHKQFLPHHGKSISIIVLDDYLPVNSVSSEAKETYLIIPICGDGHVGILATAIIDTIDTNIQLENDFQNHPGIKGSAVINNHVTIFLDCERLLDSAGITVESERSAEWQADHMQHSY